jgi:hypothetical protein
MIRDFKDFTGLAPSQYFDLERPILGVAAREILKFLAETGGPLHPTVERFGKDVDAGRNHK